MTRNEYIEANLTLNLLNQIIDAHGKLVSLSQQQTDNKFALTLRFSDGTTGYTAYAAAIEHAHNHLHRTQRKGNRINGNPKRARLGYRDHRPKHHQLPAR